MAKEWTDDEVQKEIRDAIAIAREDGILKHVRGLHEKLDKLMTPENPEGEPTEGQPPPEGEPKDSNAQDKKQRRSLWWGDQNA